MAIENTAGLGVNNVYGPRETAEGRSGNLPTSGVVKELELDFRGDSYDKVSATLPKGAQVIECIAEVVEAFALGGTTPTINVGTSGSAGTNYGIELSEAQAEAAGTTKYDATKAGTWQSVLAAATTVAVELDGTTPTIGDGGLAKVVIRYVEL
jgi:hypothetical protein